MKLIKNYLEAVCFWIASPLEVLWPENNDQQSRVAKKITDPSVAILLRRASSFVPWYSFNSSSSINLMKAWWTDSYRSPQNGIFNSYPSSHSLRQLTIYWRWMNNKKMDKNNLNAYTCTGHCKTGLWTYNKCIWKQNGKAVWLPIIVKALNKINNCDVSKIFWTALFWWSISGAAKKTWREPEEFTWASSGPCRKSDLSIIFFTFLEIASSHWFELWQPSIPASSISL